MKGLLTSRAELRWFAVAVPTLFLAHWSEQKGPPLDHDLYFPSITPLGGEVARIVGSTPDEKTPRFYITLLSAVRNAEKNVWLSAAYFVPTDQEEQELVAAGRPHQEGILGDLADGQHLDVERHYAFPSRSRIRWRSRLRHIVRSM